MVSTLPPTSKSSSPFSNPFVIVPNTPITIGIIATFMFHSFFNSIARSRYLSFFSYSFIFILWSAGIAKSTILQVLFFLLIIIRSGLLDEIRWSVCMSLSHRSLCVSFSKTGVGLCIYHLFVLSNLNCLHISQWITLPTQSCLVLYSFCANLRHLLTMWLMVSSLSPHSPPLLFSCVLSILALIYWFLWRCFVLLLLLLLLILMLILLLFTLLRVFQTSVSWVFLTGVWVIAILLKFPRLFSVQS